MRRALDFVEGRADIDRGRLAFYGLSMARETLDGLDRYLGPVDTRASRP